MDGGIQDTEVAAKSGLNVEATSLLGRRSNL
jgi:hypothetical protein